MPIKHKKTHHRTPHDKTGHRRGKKFLKVYAPYIPLLLILGTGFIISTRSNFRHYSDRVLSYAVEMSSNGLVDAANKERVAQNKQILRINEKLTQAAQKKAEDMASRNYWSHTTPEGQQPWIFIQESGYNYTKAAENLAYGFATSEDATTGWMNSPSHRANLLNGDLSEVGFGVANVANYQNRGPQTVVVAMYGKPLPSLMSSQPASASPVAAAAIQPETTAPSSQKITLAQSLTKGSLPWINLAIGILLGGTAVYLLTKHAWNLRRVLVRGERFILHHPLLDITLVALIALTALLSQTTGFIH